MPCLHWIADKNSRNLFIKKWGCLSSPVPNIPHCHATDTSSAMEAASFWPFSSSISHHETFWVCKKDRTGSLTIVSIWQFNYSHKFAFLMVTWWAMCSPNDEKMASFWCCQDGKALSYHHPNLSPNHLNTWFDFIKPSIRAHCQFFCSLPPSD